MVFSDASDVKIFRINFTSVLTAVLFGQESGIYAPNISIFTRVKYFYIIF